jgi:hypothetical protein
MTKVGRFKHKGSRKRLVLPGVRSILTTPRWSVGVRLWRGPSFPLPGLILAIHVKDHQISIEWACKIFHYLQAHVNKGGGLDLRPEGPLRALAT